MLQDSKGLFHDAPDARQRLWKWPGRHESNRAPCDRWGA
jgi:hypothetical protein